MFEVPIRIRAFWRRDAPVDVVEEGQTGHAAVEAAAAATAVAEAVAAAAAAATAARATAARAVFVPPVPAAAAFTAHAALRPAAPGAGTDTGGSRGDASSPSSSWRAWNTPEAVGCKVFLSRLPTSLSAQGLTDLLNRCVQLYRTRTAARGRRARFCCHSRHGARTGRV
jgi:hypothetical protein